MSRKRTFNKFEDWQEYDVRMAFELVLIEKHPLLTTWLTVNGNIPQEHLRFVEQLRFQLSEHHRYWNETDLLMKFIGPLLTLIEFTGDRYDNFSEVKLTLTHHNKEISGFADWLVATGRYEPQMPFFFLHEYKRLKGTQADPLGQLLIAMLAAQRWNTDAEPLLGAYVMGHLWQFVLLNGKEYSVSQSYDATDVTELCTIYLVLQKAKKGIEAKVATLPEINLFDLI